MPSWEREHRELWAGAGVCGARVGVCEVWGSVTPGVGEGTNSRALAHPQGYLPFSRMREDLVSFSEGFCISK